MASEPAQRQDERATVARQAQLVRDEMAALVQAHAEAMAQEDERHESEMRRLNSELELLHNQRHMLQDRLMAQRRVHNARTADARAEFETRIQALERALRAATQESLASDADYTPQTPAAYNTV